MATNTLAMTRRGIVGGALAAADCPLRYVGRTGAIPGAKSRPTSRSGMTFNDLSLTATLYDNPSARDFASMFPLDLRIEEYGEQEDRPSAAEAGRGRQRPVPETSGPATSATSSHGAISPCFYDDYRWDKLIRLGRFDGGFEPLLVRGAYPVRIERFELSTPPSEGDQPNKKLHDHTTVLTLAPRLTSSPMTASLR